MINRNAAATLAAEIVVLTGAGLAMASTPQQWQYKEDKLDNGMRVLTMEDHRSPLVNLQVWYHVGSKDEDPNRQGFAHMFEHMMFRGTERIGPQDHFKYLDRYGAQVNGYTSWDMTVYWETVPAAQFDRALWLEAERLAHLKISEDYFAAEREVVKEERRVNYLNKPYGLAYETLSAAMFKVHPYRWMPIGNMTHLDAASAAELQKFFDTFYVPNNAALVVVGAISHEQVMARAREYFGPIPRRPDPPRVTLKEPPKSKPARVEMEDIAPAPRVTMAYLSPPATDPESVTGEILGDILSRGQSSRLYRHLVQGREIAVTASAGTNAFEQYGVFLMSVTLKPGVKVEDAEAALQQELAELFDRGVSQEELEKARNQALADYVRTGETVRGRADKLGYAAVISGDPERVNADLERIRTMRTEQVMALAKQVFREDNRVTLIVRPGKQAPTSEATEDKSKREEKVPDLPPPREMPAGRAPSLVDLPGPVLRRLENGLRVAVFQDSSTPAVTISYNALIGSRNDPPEQAGLANVTVNTMRRGTSRHTGEELAERIDRLGMTLVERPDDYDTRYGIWTLSEHVETAVETLAEILREPTFPEQEVSGFVARAVAREKINEKTPSVIASRTLARALHGEHFLGRPASGTSDTLKRITREAVVGFHQQFFGPAGATLVFAGDIAPEQAFALAERLFADWRPQAGRALPVPSPLPAATRVLLVDRPGAVQSDIRIGQLVPVSRKNADYPAARLVSQLFGESFGGRLNRRLRIEKGLTYSARGYFDVRADVAVFQVSTFTRPEKTDEAIAAAVEEIDRLRNGSITADELAESRDNLIGRFQMNLETVAQVASNWWELTVNDLPQDWYGQYLRSVASVESPGVLDAVAKRTLDPARLVIVVVGDAARIEPQLRKIAPVELIQEPASQPTPAG